MPAPAILLFATAASLLFAQNATAQGPASVITPAALTGIYRGEDGGALYVLGRGAEVVAFAEHPGRRYAFVLRGTVSGDRVKADWWDVPKGERVDKGTVELQILNGGKTLRRASGGSFGPSRYDAISPSQVPWPPRLSAGFQSSGTGDITGAYNGDDNSRWYIRATPFNTVGVIEAAAQPGERPAFVSVFFGKRADPARSSFSGDWYDVPKGVQSKSGRLGAALLGPVTAVWNREIVVELTGVDRARRIEPDYAVDYKAMGARIESLMEKSGAVGWAYAIATPAGLVQKNAGGNRRLRVDAGEDLKFSTKTLTQAASFSKTSTAIALAKVLHAGGHSFDTKVAPFLPKCWTKRGPGVSALTFGDIAAHHTGFAPPSGSDYEIVKKTFENGQVRPVGPTTFDYENINYGVLRYLVPLVARRDEAQAVFDRWDCRDSNGDQINGEISKMFARIVLLETMPQSVAREMSFLPSSGDVAFLYNWKDPSIAGLGPNAKGVEKAGAGYLSQSVESGAMMLRALDSGEIVPVGVARTMKQNRFGFDSWKDTKAGKAAHKNGGCPESSEGHRCATWGVIFPGRTYAYIAVNSRSSPKDSSGNGLTLGEVLWTSYDAAFK